MRAHRLSNSMWRVRGEGDTVQSEAPDCRFRTASYMGFATAPAPHHGQVFPVDPQFLEEVFPNLADGGGLSRDPVVELVVSRACTVPQDYRNSPSTNGTRTLVTKAFRAMPIPAKAPATSLT